MAPAGRGTRLLRFDRSGRQLSALGDDAEYSNLELSPDGSQLLVSVPDPVARTRDIWVVDVARGVRTRVTFDRSDERSAVWTPDGKGVAYTSKGLDFYTRTLGAGAETPLLVDHVSKDPMGLTPDGRFLVYRASGGKTKNDIWILPLARNAKPYPFLNSPFDENSAMLSADGRWLAYVSDESGQQEVYVTAFPSGQGKWRISANGGIFPRWRRDGHELFYLAHDLKMMSVKVGEEHAALAVAAAVPLFQTSVAVAPGRPYDVSADGERFVISSTVASSGAPSLTIVFNWPQLIAKQPAR